MTAGRVSAHRVLMVEPVGFGANPETAADNAFQRAGPAPDPGAVERAAKAEFARVAEALVERGVEVEVHVPADRATPDAVYPNNWFSTTPEGTLVLYPMRAENRRRERRPAIVAALRERYPDVVDLTGEEAAGRYLEGTGSLVLDPVARIAYAAVSGRTDPGLARDWAARFGYEPLLFRARDSRGRAIYHTNVLLAIGTGWAIVCAEAIADTVDRTEVLASLAETGHETVVISRDQMGDFAANAIELENAAGKRFVVLSEGARSALAPEQRAVLERHAELVAVGLATIETWGGGGARCMIAELW